MLNEKLVAIIGWMVIGISALVSILDLIGLLDSESAIGARIQPLTLLLLAAFATYLVYSQGQQTQRLETLPDIFREEFSSLVDTVGMGVELYPEASKGYSLMSELISNANSEILQVALSNPMPRAHELVDPNKYKEYEQAFDKAVDKGIQYTYIAIPRPNDSARRHRIERLQAKHKANFRFKIFDVSQPEELPPLYNFLIVDRSIIAFHLPHVLNKHVWMSSKHPILIEQFSEYFYAIFSIK